MNKEKWKTLRGTRKYEVSNMGRVRNKQTRHILSPALDRYGYPKFSFIGDNGQKVHKTVHRAVAETWIKNPKRKKQVNHIVGDKLNNAVSNLEWATAKENVNHSYVNLLNRNTSHLTVLDLNNGQRSFFKSFKELGKTIGVYPSVLVPLVRMSEKNPVLGRYVISVNDEKLMSTRANTVNDGIAVYVLDELTGNLAVYASLLIASYWTGLRCLSNIRKTGDYIDYLGYQISPDGKKLILNRHIDKEQLAAKRLEYLMKPYVSNVLIYYTYDYFTKEENEFKDLESMVAFLDEAEPKHRRATKSRISCALGTGMKSNRSALYKGFGIRSSLHGYGWFPYTEETILSNRNGLCATHIFYRIFENGKSELVIGKDNLCRRLGYVHDKSYQSFDLEEVVKAANIPNLSVVRLNKPIP